MDNMHGEKIEILKLLIENKEEIYSIRKISLLRKINYKSAYNAIKTLEKEGIVELKKAGNTMLCSFNNKFNRAVFIAEYSRRENLFKKREFSIIYDSLSKLEFPFIILLFGSYVKGTATKHSDIDLCLITDDSEINEQANTILSITPVNIHFQEFTSEDFLSMIKSKKSNVGNEIIKNNIVLYGIENFYELVNNVKQ